MQRLLSQLNLAQKALSTRRIKRLNPLIKKDIFLLKKFFEYKIILKDSIIKDKTIVLLSCLVAKRLLNLLSS